MIERVYTFCFGNSYKFFVTSKILHIIFIITKTNMTIRIF
jgi:hypothetical protein